MRFGLCYQFGSGALFQFAPNLNYSLIEVDTTRTSVSAAMTTGQLAAGTYSAGLCVRNEGAVAIDDNDYVNGWVAVTQ